MAGYAGIFSCDRRCLLSFFVVDAGTGMPSRCLGRLRFPRASCDFRQVIPSTKCRTPLGPLRFQHFTGPKALPLDSSKGAALCTPGRRCRPAPGSKTGSHAFNGMASCFAGLVRVGALWCERYCAVRGWTWDCGAHEHQRPSAAEAVQSVVKVIFVRLVASDVRRRCRRCGYVQRLQQITKLSGCCCQLIPDDGANRLPKPFIRGCLAIDSLQRLLQAHAIADVDFDDLHIHKVPLFQLWTAYRKIDSEIKHPPVVELRKSKLR